MKNIILLYFKTLLFLGIPTFLTITLLSLLESSQYNPTLNFWLSISFSVLISLAVVISHISLLKHYGVKKFTKKNIDVEQEEHVTSSHSLEKIKRRLVDIFPRVEILDSSSEDLTFRTSDSWFSPGEKITIHKEGSSNLMSNYTIRSRPKYRITTTDMGKNRQNVNKIVSLFL